MHVLPFKVISHCGLQLNQESRLQVGGETPTVAMETGPRNCISRLDGGIKSYRPRQARGQLQFAGRSSQAYSGRGQELRCGCAWLLLVNTHVGSSAQMDKWSPGTIAAALKQLFWSRQSPCVTSVRMFLETLPQACENSGARSIGHLRSCDHRD